jgi:hypothetical protein
MPEAFETLLDSDFALTGLVSAISLFAVWIPFFGGLRIALRAAAATRKLRASELRQSAGALSAGAVEPLAMTLIRVLRKSLFESDRESYPTEFVVDASKQYAMNEYDAHYAGPISMYANLLPPIGFIGTTTGMLILFFSMHASNESLELGALALALTSSIFALVAFAVLEGLKIRLYTRLLGSLQHALYAAQSKTTAEAKARPRTASARAR